MRVRAKNDVIAKHIRHLPTGLKFRDGVAEWPDDQFTQRRIRDGDVEVVPADEAVAPVKKNHHSRVEPATE
jgi:hypothetical protein